MNKLKLLNFSPDYLALNLVKKEDLTFSSGSKCHSWLTFLFNLPYNFTNANTFENIGWIDTDQTVDLLFYQSKNGPAIMVSIFGVNIISITKIEEGSSMAQVSPYLYRIDFYGQFFNLERLCKLDISAYLKNFIFDIENGLISSSIGRIDICADIANCLPRYIEKGFDSKLDLKITRIKEDKENGPETINFVNSKRKTIRAYNKLIEAEYKKKTWFLDYYIYCSVTRLEVELHTEYCKKLNIKISDILDGNALLGIYLASINTSKYHFKISSFIKSELEKNNYSLVKPKITSIDKHNILASCKYAKRFFNQAKKLRAIYELNPLIILLRDKTHLLDLEQEEAREFILSSHEC